MLYNTLHMATTPFPERDPTGPTAPPPPPPPPPTCSTLLHTSFPSSTAPRPRYIYHQMQRHGEWMYNGLRTSSCATCAASPCAPSLPSHIGVVLPAAHEHRVASRFAQQCACSVADANRCPCRDAHLACGGNRSGVLTSGA